MERTCKTCNKVFTNYEDCMNMSLYNQCIDCRESEQLGVPDVVKQYIDKKLLSESSVKLALIGMYEELIQETAEQASKIYHIDIDNIYRYINR